MAEKQFTIISEAGIHARPATLIVNASGQIDGEVELQCNGKTVNAKSIMGVLSLGVTKGQEVTISATGDGSENFIQELEDTLRKEGLIA
jgi:phosphocarrier protein HPr